MAEKFVSKRNIRFMLYEIFNVEELCQYEYFSDHSRETFDMVIDTIYKVGTDMMYPLLQEMDANPPVYRNGQAHVHPAVKQYIKQCGEGGWIGPGFAYEVGGQQIPALLVNTVTYMNATANYPLSVYPGLTSGAANLILSFGSQEQKDLYVKKMISGEWQGTMALTEPDAGSSLADIRTQVRKPAKVIIRSKAKKYLYPPVIPTRLAIPSILCWPASRALRPALKEFLCLLCPNIVIPPTAGWSSTI
jgi:butyryl-CoA dehydrogenase